MINILIVDDEDDIRKSLGNFLLKRINCDITCCSDGLQAEKNIIDNEYDFVFLDLKLPGKSGVDLLEDIRKKESNVPVIVISAYDALEIREQITNLNALFMPKPISLMVVFEKIKEILEKKGKFVEKQP